MLMCATCHLTSAVALRYNNRVPIPHYSTPGQLIQDQLDRRGWSRRILAIILRADETGINRLISGKRPVDAEMAIRLGETFNIRPEHFLALQRRYDLAQARLVTRPDPERAQRARVFGELPIAE